MELIKGFISAIICGAVGRQVSREFNAWTPWFVERLIRRAVTKLPESQRERFGEEWRSHIGQIPGDIGKLVAAIGFGSAARGISAVVHPSRNHFSAHGAFRRVCDICVSVAALILLLPLMFGVGILIRLESDGPIFFRNVRLRPNGDEFSVWKFRTMVLSVAQLKLHSDFRGSVSSPRITRVGRLLRRYSIDEMPMFINVLRGDTTLFGPRPRD